MMSGDVGRAGLQLRLTRADVLGIALACVSTVVLALYMIVVRRTAQDDVSGEAVFVTQVVALASVTLLLSFLLSEDWDRWGVLGLADWLVFAVFSLGVLLGANVTQIGALRHLGAPLVSTLMAWRLVSALVIAALLLGERLTSPSQVFGAVIVLVTITWYLSRQAMLIPMSETATKANG